MQDQASLYEKIRSTGFIHFQTEELEASFDWYYTSHLQIQAEKQTYLFIERTDLPVSTEWSEEMDELVSEVQRLYKKYFSK